jgi:hypothetical protein
MHVCMQTHTHMHAHTKPHNPSRPHARTHTHTRACMLSFSNNIINWNIVIIIILAGQMMATHKFSKNLNWNGLVNYDFVCCNTPMTALILWFTFLLNPNGHNLCCLHLEWGWEETSNTFPLTFLPGADSDNIGAKNFVRFFIVNYG